MMKKISDRMKTVLETLDAAPAEGADAAPGGLDVKALANHIALAFEALAPDGEPKDLMKALKTLSMGKEKSLMLSTLRRFTAAKANKTLRTVKKELS